MGLILLHPRVIQLSSCNAERYTWDWNQVSIYRRQILASKVGPHTERVNALTIAATRRHSANTSPTLSQCWVNIFDVLMLAHRLRRWLNIEPSLVQYLVFSGILLYTEDPGRLR